MQIDISVIIVAYNARRFIGLCLQSIKQTEFQGETEIIVIDNNSSEDCSALIAKYYPDVKYVQNSENVGFSKACNQGADMAGGKYLCFINPDCLIAPNAFDLCVSAERSIEKIGAIAGHMVDGGLNTLPESKRKWPTLLNSIGRVTRLDRIFKNGPLDYYDRGRYDEDSEVDVLTGAFLFIEKEKFDKAGRFDEQFFMYGEDIDLCRSLHNRNYRNHFLGKLKLIHFKGESSDTSHYQHHHHFYKSAYLYFKKHISAHRFWTFLLLVIISFVRVLRYFSVNFLSLIIDYLVLTMIVSGTARLWAAFHYGNTDYFDFDKIEILFWIYPLFWIGGLTILGYYWLKQRKSTRVIVKGFLLGLLFLLMFYALLPEDYRFSRMVLLLSTLSATLFYIVRQKLIQMRRHTEGLVLWSKDDLDNSNSVLFKHFSNDIRQVRSAHAPDDLAHNNLIVDVATVRVEELVSKVVGIGRKPKIFYWDKRQGTIFDSQKSIIKGETYDALSLYRLSDPYMAYSKGVFDKMLCIVLFLLTPFSVVKGSASTYLFNIGQIWKGVKTIVGYRGAAISYRDLTPIRSCIVPIRKAPGQEYLDDSSINENYAMHYTIWSDLYTCIVDFKTLFSQLNLKEC